MIENRELYSFEETNDPAASEPSEAETGLENPETAPPKILYQSIVAFLCLLITISLCRQEHGWAYWLRKRLHYAFNASTQSTFGLLWNSTFFQKIVQNGNNLIRLEKVTQTLSRQETSPAENSFAFEASVWPVPGNIIKEFGESYQNGSFGSGVVIETTDQARVLAVTAGTIAGINQISGGWKVEIDHGSGWTSVYQPLSNLQIKLRQTVETGQYIGRTGLSGNGYRDKMFLEIKYKGQPVDPRSMIH